MSTHAVLSLVRCAFCSKARPPSRVHQLATNAQVICDDCIEWHNRALDLLAGNAMPGCQGCGASWEKLRDSSTGVESRLYVVPRDGILQVLCPACLRAYVPKRADIYRDTPFGHGLHL